MNWWLKVIKNYAGFSGRSRRKEYWMFALFNLIFLIVACVIDRILGTNFTMRGIQLPYGWVYLAYALAVLIPGLAVLVRRLHDVGKSGWFFFIILIPLVGAIWILVLVCTDGNPGENKYGANPKTSIPASGTV